MRRPSPLSVFLPCIAVLLAFGSAPADAFTDADHPSAVSPLEDYTSCHFSDGLMIVQVDALPPGVQQRTVQTAHGVEPIRMSDGRRVMFAYPLSDFYANVKPEVLPADTYGQEKKTLLAELDAALASTPDNVRNTQLPPSLHGLEAHGFDRGKLEGGVLGFYLFFDDARHIATSIYLLNAEPLTRKFETMAQYRDLRDHFLTTYAGCIEQNHLLHK